MAASAKLATTARAPEQRDDLHPERARSPCKSARPSLRTLRAFAKQLKSQGDCFVGPTSVYAFMQNIGVVNDHVHGCFRATDYEMA
jgi:DNA-3-methyladenine glycosylase I